MTLLPSANNTGRPVVCRASMIARIEVETGITGSTDIEVTKGLSDKDEIVTGTYKILRSLKNGAAVKIDNSAATKDES